MYEPDGNIPPDLLADGRVAVEVRQLNQRDKDDARDLFETNVSLINGIRAILRSFGPPQNEPTWFFNYRFSRPVRPWKRLRSELAIWLGDIRQRQPSRPEYAKFGERFEASVLRASEPLDHVFELGGSIDEDSVGLLVHELQRAAQHAATEKSRKVRPYRDRYPVWWLVLVDHIGYGLNDFERELRAARPALTHDFDKVVAVSPLDPSRFYEF